MIPILHVSDVIIIDRTDASRSFLREGFWAYKLNSFVLHELNLKDLLDGVRTPTRWILIVQVLIDLSYHVGGYSGWSHYLQNGCGTVGLYPRSAYVEGLHCLKKIVREFKGKLIGGIGLWTKMIWWV